MMKKPLRAALTAGAFSSLIIIPFVTVMFTLYYMFSGTAKSFLFNTVTIDADADAGRLSFEISQNYFYLLIATFFIVFAVMWLFTSWRTKRAEAISK
ncbi:hypothetical protein [Shouchella lonarensis]|uniref:Uncharacterized protein n=1 Tax=Shouchella lonarensis TaxID=1464122 RepID=A0A1G6M5S0_9BACI|nr:hypothetical protein [Shouchella lonarensis]SDC50902.1 hypothetical protein SAMN05421737_109102 [Shouchella lonarensis]